MVKAAKPRKYYSVRTGKNPDVAQLSLPNLKGLFFSGFKQLQGQGYFNEAFGFWCVDNDDVPGTAGSDIANYVLFHTRRHLWPIDANLDAYSEHDLFDLIEFLHDHVSKPVSGQFHRYGGCGMHWEVFDAEEGRREFREMMNPLLESYAGGFQLNDRGEIMEVGPQGLTKLLSAQPPTKDTDVRARMQSAIDRFQRYGSSSEERRHAVRDLADVLEKLRDQVKPLLNKKDEGDLFNLANNFGIRHFNANQKTDYDPAVWLSWMFYYYLATINACLHLLERSQASGKSAA
jgi:hypothetical protein